MRKFFEENYFTHYLSCLLCSIRVTALMIMLCENLNMAIIEKKKEPLAYGYIKSAL